MTYEEKKAIEYDLKSLNQIMLNFEDALCDDMQERVKRISDLIEKQEKVIDKMASYINKNIDVISNDIDVSICCHNKDRKCINRKCEECVSCLHGYTNYYPSNDRDLARITAVTMEQGTMPHYRIEVEYLTNSNGVVETDTFYCYIENNQLVEKAYDNLYKEVWIVTGYKGGYETYKDFGTNLLKEIYTKEEMEAKVSDK